MNAKNSKTESYGDERRRTARQNTAAHIRYRTIGEVQIETMKDISRTGAFVSCREPFSLGTVLELQLFPDVDPGFTVEAKVVRVVWGGRQGGQSIEPGMALAFEPLDEDVFEKFMERMEGHLTEMHPKGAGE